MKKYFLLACAFCVFGVADAATIQFSSPDKKLQVTVADDGGRPCPRQHPAEHRDKQKIQYPVGGTGDNVDFQD